MTATPKSRVQISVQRQLVWQASLAFDPQAELRKQFVAAVAAHARAVEALGFSLAPSLDFTPYIDLRCGARGKRTGKPCPQKGLFSNGRCRWHGGLSTGPKTAEGKARSALNGQRAVQQDPQPGADQRQPPSTGDLGLPPEVSTALSEPFEAGPVESSGVTVEPHVGKPDGIDPPIKPVVVEPAALELPARTLQAAGGSEASASVRPRWPLAAVRAVLDARPGRTWTAGLVASAAGLEPQRVERLLALLVGTGRLEPVTVGGPSGQAAWRDLADPRPDWQPASAEREPGEVRAVLHALRAAGVPAASIRPRDPRLLALVRAGAAADDFLVHVPAALDDQEPFNRVIGAVEAIRMRSRDLDSALSRGAMPPLRRAFA